MEENYIMRMQYKLVCVGIIVAMFSILSACADKPVSNAIQVNIAVYNQAWFATYVKYSYKHNGEEHKHTSDPFSAGYSKKYSLPRGAADIKLYIHQSDLSGSPLIKEYDKFNNGDNCYKVEGSAGLGKVVEC